MAPWLAGCEPMGEALIQDRALLWLVLSFVLVGLAGGAAIWWSYLRRLKNWDHGSSLCAPDSSRVRNILIGVVVAVVLAFAFYNWFSDIGIPPDQQWQNILGWTGGSAAGGVLAYMAGRRLASASYRKPIEDGGQRVQGRFQGEDR